MTRPTLNGEGGADGDTIAALDPAAPGHFADQAHRVIEAMIFRGELLPGDPLDERRLAERFHMSRTPVREAIQRLAAQELVRIVPRQGIFVAKISIKSLWNQMEMLQELEASCARLAARRITAAGRQALAQACDECDDAATRQDALAYEEANAAFHRVLYDASSNRYLTEQILAIRLRTGVYRRRLFATPGRLRTSANEHRRLLEAMLRGDEPAVIATMREHIVFAGPGFAELISSIPEQLLES